jgi:hypothetical protein
VVQGNLISPESLSVRLWNTDGRDQDCANLDSESLFGAPHETGLYVRLQKINAMFAIIYPHVGNSFWSKGRCRFSFTCRNWVVEAQFYSPTCRNPLTSRIVGIDQRKSAVGVTIAVQSARWDVSEGAKMRAIVLQVRHFSTGYGTFLKVQE